MKMNEKRAKSDSNCHGFNWSNLNLTIKKIFLKTFAIFRVERLYHENTTTHKSNYFLLFCSMGSFNDYLDTILPFLYHNIPLHHTAGLDTIFIQIAMDPPQLSLYFSFIFFFGQCVKA